MSTTTPGKCEDFDECAGSATANSATEYAYNCAANSYCLNTIGSHLCICNDGFMGNGMDVTGGCSDIDEWLVSNFIPIFSYNQFRDPRTRTEALGPGPIGFGRWIPELVKKSF